jgi:hypothetical protein
MLCQLLRRQSLNCNACNIETIGGTVLTNVTPGTDTLTIDYTGPRVGRIGGQRFGDGGLDPFGAAVPS